MTANDSSNPSPSDLIELKQLIARDAAGNLTRDERDRLEQLLMASRESRSIYIAYMQMDSELCWQREGSDSLHELRALAAELPEGAGRPVSNPPAPQRGDHRWGPRHWGSALAGLAVCLLLALGSLAWMQDPGGHDVALGDPPDQANPGAASGVNDPGADAPVAATVVELTEGCSWFVEDRPAPHDSVRVGDLIRVTKGELRLDFGAGATITMRSPGALEVLSPMRTRAVLGTLTAHVDQQAIGFTVETPRTTVVDLGTDFGIDVSAHGSTDVVVFNGAVDLHSEGVEGLSSRQRLRAGEGVRVSGEGTASRIVSIFDGQFSTKRVDALVPSAPVISSVRDNVSRGESWHYYEIVRGGMREDAKAFVDRTHEWNGVDASGIPSYLLGADYVKTFNDDKLNRNVKIELVINRAAVLYVLVDDRSPTPEWLYEYGFVNTGDEIGIDGAGYTRRSGGLKKLGLGPGASVDDTFLIWRRDILEPGVVKLGAMRFGAERHNMYAIAAAPLEFGDHQSDMPGVLAEPTREFTPAPRSEDGLLEVEGAIERPGDVDVFRFDWDGGPARVACQGSLFATLDPVLRVHAADGTLIGFAAAARGAAAVELTAPPGPCYVTVSGRDELGEVGAYRLTMDPAADETPPLLSPTPLIQVDATDDKSGGVRLSWSAAPAARSYTVERSRDAVRFDAVASTRDVTFIDADLTPGARYVYRVQANTDGATLTSAARLVQAPPATTDRLNAFGDSSRSIVLGWRDVVGERGYRLERSSGADRFEAIAALPPNSSGYRDSEVEPGREYSYRLVTLGDAGFERASTAIGSRTGPGGLTAEPLASGQVRLSWDQDPVRSSLSFVERTLGDSGMFVKVGSVNAEQTTFVDASAPAGEELRYRLATVRPAANLIQASAGELERVRLPDDMDDYFALRITGQLTISKPGLYTFHLNSDDGSRLFIDGSLVVDNDWLHSPHVSSGSVELTPGPHELDVQYFERYGYDALDLSWEAPGVPRAEIPESAYRSLTYRCYSGHWSRLPFVENTAVSDVAVVETPAPDEPQ